ncbi:hypothetical protein HN358_03715 [Candidatus Uhrbacteria bacterium]|jgi:hypothetical protein|nr:hypothetical protein [Candidatus Uhrbacteria bacterium]MBT7717242.1 hypothetical protein [Candidatus Uhrbacteria bacterium]
MFISALRNTVRQFREDIMHSPFIRLLTLIAFITFPSALWAQGHMTPTINDSDVEAVIAELDWTNLDSKIGQYCNDMQTKADLQMCHAYEGALLLSLSEGAKQLSLQIQLMAASDYSESVNVMNTPQSFDYYIEVVDNWVIAIEGYADDLEKKAQVYGPMVSKAGSPIEATKVMLTEGQLAQADAAVLEFIKDVRYEHAFGIVMAQVAGFDINQARRKVDFLNIDDLDIGALEILGYTFRSEEPSRYEQLYSPHPPWHGTVDPPAKGSDRRR